MNDPPSFRNEPEADRLCILVAIGSLFAAAPASAQADLAAATTKLTLQSCGCIDDLPRLRRAVAAVDGALPATVAFEIDRISAYQIDEQ